jgi:hypothetical protein
VAKFYVDGELVKINRLPNVNYFPSGSPNASFIISGSGQDRFLIDDVKIFPSSEAGGESTATDAEESGGQQQ